MSVETSQACRENASYFSEKCRQCQFPCLKPATEQIRQKNEGRSAFRTLSLIGWGVIAAATAAAIGDYPHIASALSVFGAAAILTNMFRQ